MNRTWTWTCKRPVDTWTTGNVSRTDVDLDQDFSVHVRNKNVSWTTRQGVPPGPQIIDDFRAI